MSRVGQSPVVVPDGVSIEILDGILTAKGKLGRSRFQYPARLMSR